MTHTLTVAENSSERLICRTGGLNYTPDVMRHKYGESKRRPLEDWFLDELKFFESNYPDYSIFTLGSSLVFGERFITYLTICELEISGPNAFANVVDALKASDRAIRRKLSAMWKWDIAAIKDTRLVLVVGWLDFAYFLQHRTDFLDKSHGHHMRSFVDAATPIQSKDYKVLRDGAIVPFDPDKLSPEDLTVYKNYNAIQYERVSPETLV